QRPECAYLKQRMDQSLTTRPGCISSCQRVSLCAHFALPGLGHASAGWRSKYASLGHITIIDSPRKSTIALPHPHHTLAHLSTMQRQQAYPLHFTAVEQSE